MIFQTNFKVNDEEDPELASWLRSFKSSRAKSYHIRQAIKFYLAYSGKPPAPSRGPAPPLDSFGEVPEISLVVSEEDIGRGESAGKELTEDELLKKLDENF